jgi:hypothetical protein
MPRSWNRACISDLEGFVVAVDAVQRGVCGPSGAPDAARKGARTWSRSASRAVIVLAAWDGTWYWRDRPGLMMTLYRGVAHAICSVANGVGDVSGHRVHPAGQLGDGEQPGAATRAEPRGQDGTDLRLVQVDSAEQVALI